MNPPRRKIVPWLQRCMVIAASNICLVTADVSLARWTPNVARLRCRARTVISAVVVNQNFDPEWHTRYRQGRVV